MNINKPTLVVLAAGIGSRYGGLKQLDTFTPEGDTIIDFSIYDALEAGLGNSYLSSEKVLKKSSERRLIKNLKEKRR